MILIIAPSCKVHTVYVQATIVSSQLLYLYICRLRPFGFCCWDSSLRTGVEFSFLLRVILFDVVIYSSLWKMGVLRGSVQVLRAQG